MALHLIRGGADVNHCVENQTPHKTPIHLAADKGQLDVIGVLVDFGVSVDSVDDFGRTALHLAARSNHIDLVEYLVERGAYLHQEDNFKRTPLVMAVEMNHFEASKWFVDHGAHISAKTTDGWCALTYSVVNGHVDIASYLVEFGADVNAVDNSSQTALIHACQRVSIYQLGVLNSTNDKPYLNQAIPAATMVHRELVGFADQNKWLPIIFLLLNNGADVRARDVHGYTCLDWAFLKGVDHDSLSMLVRAGAQLHELTSLYALKKPNVYLPSSIAMTSLLRSTVFTIRLALRRNIDEKALRLPLPKPLIKNIVLNHEE